MQDIVPELLEKLQSDFDSRIKSNESLQNLLRKVETGAATYSDAHDYAIEVGEILGKVYKDNLSSDILPDGKMYYNIANRIIPPTMQQDYDLVAATTMQIQQTLNETAGIGLKAAKSEFPQDRVDGIVNKVSEAEQYNDVSWVLEEPVANFSQSIVDDILQANVLFQFRSGMNPKIIRRSNGRCCEWCASVAGTYDYPDVPRDVYRRHERCRCKTEYFPSKRKKQDVWSKEWKKESIRDKIELKKSIQKNPANQYRKVRNSELPNGLPIMANPGEIVDKVDDFGNVQQRRVHGDDGRAAVDFDVTDHGMRKIHPTGAHKHVFDYEKKRPRGKPEKLTKEELEENKDIIKKGENYYDED